MTTPAPRATVSRLSILIACLALAAVAGAAAPPAKAPETPEATIATYRTALEALQPRNAAPLFASDAQIFEGGSAEGRAETYIAHHLEPEFAEFRTFRFSDVSQTVQTAGDIAWVGETYRFRITLKSDGREIERKGAATYVLRRIGGAWRIQMLHSSSRPVDRPKSSSAEPAQPH